MKKKTILAYLIAATVLVSMVAGCGTSNSSQSSSSAQTGFHSTKTKGYVIGFANGYFGNTWRAQFINDAQKVADQYKAQGVISKFIVENVNDDATQQVQQLNSLIDQGVDCLLINPVSPSALAPVIKRALAKNILIVNVDDPCAYEGTYSVLGDHQDFFGIQTKWLAQTLNGKGNIVYISGLNGNSCDTLRTAYAKNILSKYPDIKILASAPGGWNETTSEKDMSNFLATYPKINGVLEQDVMAEGTMRAYDIAGKPYPPMTGDYTYGFFRKWAQHPNMQTIGVTYNPGIGADALEVAIHILQGDQFKSGVLQPNPEKSSLVNTVIVPPAYVVTKDAQPDAAWLNDTYVPNLKEYTKAISLADALKIGQGQPDTADLDSVLSADQVASYFQSK